MVVSGEPVTEVELTEPSTGNTQEEPSTTESEPTTETHNNNGGGGSTPGRCAWCDINDKWKDVPVIGWLVAFIHLFIHMGQTAGRK